MILSSIFHQPQDTLEKLSEETRKLILHGNADVPLGISNVFRFSGQLRKKIQNGQWPGIIPSFSLSIALPRASRKISGNFRMSGLPGPQAESNRARSAFSRQRYP